VRGRSLHDKSPPILSSYYRSRLWCQRYKCENRPFLADKIHKKIDRRCCHCRLTHAWLDLGLSSVVRFKMLAPDENARLANLYGSLRNRLLDLTKRNRMLSRTWCRQTASGPVRPRRLLLRTTFRQIVIETNSSKPQGTIRPTPRRSSAPQTSRKRIMGWCANVSTRVFGRPAHKGYAWGRYFWIDMACDQRPLQGFRPNNLVPTKR